MNIYGSLMDIFDETKREAHTLLPFNSMLYLAQVSYLVKTG